MSDPLKLQISIKSCVTVFLSLLIWNWSSHAGIDPYLIKDIDVLIEPSCKEQISPIYAMGMLKSGILPNIRFWGAYGRLPLGRERDYPSCQWANPHLEDPKDCPLDYTSALIQSLFPSHAGGHLVAHQGSKDDPISHLTPENIGHIMELIHLWNIPDEGAWNEKIRDLWTLQVIQALNLENAAVKKLTQKILSQSQDHCHENGQNPENLSKLIKNLDDLTRVQRPGTKKLDLSSEISKLKSQNLWRSVAPWAEILYRALQESRQKHSLYPRFTPERALMSYLLLKGTGKETLLKFLGSTPSCLSAKGRLLSDQFQLMTQTYSSAGVDTDATTHAAPHAASPADQTAETHTPKPSAELQEFLSSHFTEDEYDQFIQHPTDPESRKTFIEELMKDPERLGYFYYLSHFTDLPPLIGGQKAAHKSLGRVAQSPRKYDLYPDCGEASVRNFFNIILYDFETRTFNSEILSQLEQKHQLVLYRDVSKKTKPGKHGVEKGLKAFYERNSDSRSLTSDQVRDDWSRRVISSLPGVSYISGGRQCEMNAGVDNTLKTIGYLLGDRRITSSGDPGQRKIALDRLCEVLSRDQFQLMWRSKSHASPQDTHETLVFSINGIDKFEWQFLPNHFSLTETFVSSLDKKKSWIKDLPRERPQGGFEEIWGSPEQIDSTRSKFSALWNQPLSNSEVRLRLLGRAPFEPASGPIAHHLTKELDLKDEHIHRQVSLAAQRTQYPPLFHDLAQVPEDLRARSAAYIGDMAQLRSLNPSWFVSKNSDGETPTHLAARRNQVAALKLIAEYAPHTLSEQNSDGETPALIALSNENLEAFTFITEKAPQTLIMKDRLGYVPATSAALSGLSEFLKLIIERAPETLATKNRRGFPPAHVLLQKQHKDSFLLLAEKYPPALYAVDDNGSTPAHLAAAMDNSMELKLIALRAIAKNAPDTFKILNQRGESALMSITDPQLREEIQEIISRHKK